MQKEIYTRTVAEVKAEVAEAYEDRPEQQAGIVALAAILRLRQVCVSPELLGKQLPEHAPKFGYMADKLEELQAEGHGALIFSQFIGGLDQMEVVAKERGIDYLRMDGRTPVSKRKEIVQLFQSGKGPAFFFISLKTGGVGLNLTRANYVFPPRPLVEPCGGKSSQRPCSPYRSDSLCFRPAPNYAAQYRSSYVGIESSQSRALQATSRRS
jgi:non-specific serine/threonine protein kinase